MMDQNRPDAETNLQQDEHAEQQRAMDDVQDDSDEADAMEQVQQDAAEERENEGGYQ